MANRKVHKAVSDKFLKACGVTRELYNEWYDVMQLLYEELNSFTKVKSEAGKLICGPYKVFATFVNSTTIDVYVTENDKPKLMIKNEGDNARTVAMVIFWFKNTKSNG